MSISCFAALLNAFNLEATGLKPGGSCGNRFQEEDRCNADHVEEEIHLSMVWRCLADANMQDHVKWASVSERAVVVDNEGVKVGQISMNVVTSAKA